ncbi:hypothetical protein CHUAL_005780 [Chamberlinius hualienensis]
MCILFFETHPNPSADEYALILINNRDEEFERPTLKCDFWKEFPYVIGGRDAFPGKEGGTWLGLSNKGRIGILLNILQPVSEINAQAKGRGGLVSNYLTSDVSCKDYLNSIYEERHLYNNFNLVTIDAKPPFGDFKIGHYSNLNDEPPEYFSPAGIYGVGNCHASTPWKKIVYGKEKFTKICAEFPKTSDKDELVCRLLDLLTDTTRHFPDPQLIKQGKGKSESVLESMSALSFNIPQIKYGTRTNSVILIDGQGNVDFVERTMEDNTDFNNPQFVQTRHRLTIK